MNLSFRLLYNRTKVEYKGRLRERQPGAKVPQRDSFTEEFLNFARLLFAAGAEPKDWFDANLHWFNAELCQAKFGSLMPPLTCLVSEQSRMRWMMAQFVTTKTVDHSEFDRIVRTCALDTEVLTTDANLLYLFLVSGDLHPVLACVVASDGDEKIADAMADAISKCEELESSFFTPARDILNKYPNLREEVMQECFGN